MEAVDSKAAMVAEVDMVEAMGWKRRWYWGGLGEAAAFQANLEVEKIFILSCN